MIKKKKFCWVTEETKKGWRLGLVIGEKPTHWLRPAVYFSSHKETEKALRGNMVVVHLSK